MPDVGDIIPDLEFRQHEGSMVTLSQLASGPALLIYFRHLM
jgi:peroxiredoxin